MKFRTPLQDQDFEIDDEWWSFAEMASFVPKGAYYPYDWQAQGVTIIAIDRIQSPAWRPFGFRKYKLMPVLFALQSPEGMLPPLELRRIESDVASYVVTNGFHRYYASVACGYTHVPALVLGLEAP